MNTAPDLLLPCKCGGGMPKPSIYLQSNIRNVTDIEPPSTTVSGWKWLNKPDSPDVPAVPAQKALVKLTCPKCDASIEGNVELNMRGTLEITAKWNEAYGVQQNV